MRVINKNLLLREESRCENCLDAWVIAAMIDRLNQTCKYLFWFGLTTVGDVLASLRLCVLLIGLNEILVPSHCANTERSHMVMCRYLVLVTAQCSCVSSIYLSEELVVSNLVQRRSI